MITWSIVQCKARVCSYTVVALISIALPLHVRPALAQDDDFMGFADQPTATRPEQINQQQYPETFNAAEEVLSQGLARKEAGPVKHTFPSPEQILEVVQVEPVQPKPAVRRIKSPQNSQDSDLTVNAETALNSDAIIDFPTSPMKQEPASQAGPKPVNSAAQAKLLKAGPATPPQSQKKPTQPAIKENALQAKLTASEGRIQDLEHQLSEAKSQLAAAELEITRLSTVVQNNSRARLNLPLASTSNVSQTSKASAIVPSSQLQPAPRVAEKVSDGLTDLQVAVIAVDKADLRLGPGKNHSALMTLRKGSRLAIEARQGEWYRVFAPNGQRAWIHSSLVRFGDGAASMNDGSSVRTRGFDAALN